MSEKKTAEIKFRTAPSFKARVQAAAAVAEVSMSEYIEAAVETQMWADVNIALGALSVQPLQEAPLPTQSEDAPAPPLGGLRDFISTSVNSAGVLTEEVLQRAIDAGLGLAASPQEDVGTSDEVGANEGAPKSWMFEAQHG